MQRILIIHGPNLNLLGKRPSELYGSLSLEEINKKIKRYAEENEIFVEIVQSNSESEIINIIQEAENKYDGIIINPAGYTHTSVAIRDSIEAVNLPVVEVHMSNILAREEFRQKSLTAPVCKGLISGFGYESYLLAIDYFLKRRKEL